MSNSIGKSLPMLNRRQFGLFGGAALGLSVFGGLKEVRADDDVLTLSFGQIGPSRHPWQTISLIDYNILDLIFDPLLTRDDDGKIINVLAESYQATAPNRFRVRFKSGIKFHDGKPLTVEDVQHSLSQSLAKNTGGSAGMYKRWLEKVEIIDANTIETVSKEAYRLVPETMASISHILPMDATLDNYTKPIGTGPYRFVDFISNDRLILERNNDYWGPAPRFQRIVLRQIPESSTRVAALSSREVDYVDNLPLDDIQGVERAGQKVLSTPSHRMMFFGFNGTGKTPFENKLVREAIYYAIDRDGINEALYNGLAYVSDGPLSPGVNFRSTDLVKYSYNPEKAKVLLAQAGFPKGFKTTLASSNNRYLRDRDVVEVVAAQLQEVGITAEVARFDFATFQREVRDDRDNKTGKYGMALSAWSNTFLDPDSGFNFLEPDNNSNYGGYNNPELNRLMKRGREVTDRAELEKIYAAAQKLVWQDDVAIVCLFNLPRISAASDRIPKLKLRPDERQLWVKV